MRRSIRVFSLIFGLVVLMSLSAMLPAPAASPQAVRKVVVHLLESRAKDPGIYSWHRVGSADGVQVVFFRGDKVYMLTYRGSWDVDYEKKSDGSWIRDRPRTRDIPLESRELSISVSPKESAHLLACPRSDMADEGLTGKVSSGTDNSFVCDKTRDFETLSDEEANKASRSYVSNRSWGRGRTRYHRPGHGAEYARSWQETYDQAIKDALEHFKEHVPPRLRLFRG